MPVFAPVVVDYWKRIFDGEALLQDAAGLRIAVDPALQGQRRFMLLETPDGCARAVMTPQLAALLASPSQPPLSVAVLRERLQKAGLALHGADCLFYLALPEKQSLAEEAVTQPAPRPLDADDSAAFAHFVSGASEEDLDGAYVELDHWAVFGLFDQQQLVCAASMFPWDGAPLADLGVLTGAEFRGRGHARRVVRAICRHAIGLGHEPQYRCQAGNAASVALAKKSGFSLFGKWDVLAAD